MFKPVVQESHVHDVCLFYYNKNDITINGVDYTITFKHS